VDPVLRSLQGEARRLAEPRCWISGDPNPRNWGLRADGSPALFDWEMFGPGVPATDLAIIIPGLGDADAYAAAADCYRAAWDAPQPLPWTSEHLARDIAIAKVASVVRLLHAHASGAARVDDQLVVWLVTAMPPWLTQLA
jgi:aminoglycoside phosphotransferase (APT) family kinase protein